MKRKVKNQKKEEELTSLRCYKCGYEYKQKLNISDRFSDLDCPKCFKNTVEINMGKK